MIASENDALPGGKVGGLGDVIRDLPVALARAGHRVSVITPDYGRYTLENPAELLAEFAVPFAGHAASVSLHRVTPPRPREGVDHLVIEHPLFAAAGAGRIYVDDDTGPFATDAHRFALFCAAVAESLMQGIVDTTDVVHCHDWHAAVFLLLRACSERYGGLRDIPAVFSIHNLSLQGVRPLRGVESALESWFPELGYDPQPILDPRHGDCVNLMRTGINLADRVHTVSPTYAKEILRPSNWSEGIVGGEGLEHDLQRINDEGRLHGILNGCDYDSPNRRVSKAKLWDLCETALDDWVHHASGNAATHYLALKRLSRLRTNSQPVHPCLVSIGRLTAQKLYLLVEPLRGRPAMKRLLKTLEPGLLIMLGSGDRTYEAFFQQCMLEHDNFLFLNGYSQTMSEALYCFGDLFLMPSIYEPCGISQMLAMREGTPCLVHRVGGLADTVENGVNGFSFGGKTLAGKQRNLLVTFREAMKLRQRDREHWHQIEEAAAEARFLWSDAARQYVDELYRTG